MALLSSLRALEEFDDEVMAGEGSEPENIAEATEVESSLIEAQEQEEELNDMSADVEVAEDAEEALEELIVVLEEAAERGGMDRYEAKLYNLNRKTIYGMMGQEIPEYKQVSVESFDGSSSRLRATKVAIEEEKGTLAKWWEAIVRFIKQMVAKVTDFVVGLFSAVQALQGRAQSLLKQAKDKDTKFEGKLTKDQQKKYGKIFRGPYPVDKVKNSFEVVSHCTDNIRSMLSNDILKELNRAAKVGVQGVKLVYEKSKAGNAGAAVSFKNTVYGKGKDGEAGKGRAASTVPSNLNLTSNIRKDKDATETPLLDLTGNPNGELLGYEKIGTLWKVGKGSIEASDGKLKTKIMEAFGRDKLSEDESKKGVSEKFGIMLDCFDGRAVIVRTRKEYLTGTGQEEGGPTTTQMDIKFASIGEVKEEDKYLFTNEMIGDSSDIERSLNQIIKNCVDIRKLSDKIKEFNKEYDKTLKEMNQNALSITGHAASVARKIGNGVKGFFTGGRALSQWVKYLISIQKDVCNVISIRMSTAPGDDSDSKDSKKDSEETNKENKEKENKDKK